MCTQYLLEYFPNSQYSVLTWVLFLSTRFIPDFHPSNLFVSTANSQVHFWLDYISWKQTIWNLIRPLRSFCFVWFDSLHPIKNLSVIKGRVYLGWTSPKLGFMFLLKDTTQWCRWGLNLRPFRLKSNTLPLSHCAPRRSEAVWSGSILLAIQAN